MDAFVSRKKRRTSHQNEEREHASAAPGEEEESTDVKLALLASLHPEVDHQFLLELLLDAEGSVEKASEALTEQRQNDWPRRKPMTVGYQSSLSRFRASNSDADYANGTASKRLLSKKGKTLHLYSPEDIENNTPCSIIHNFLPADEAEALLNEMLGESPTYGRDTFKLFDKVVESPHSVCFYVDSWNEVVRQKTDYIYNGSRITVGKSRPAASVLRLTSMQDIRRTLPEMEKAKHKVRKTVNCEIKRRIEQFQAGVKLKYQSPHEWVPNASFVNCYDGGVERYGSSQRSQPDTR